MKKSATGAWTSFRYLVYKLEGNVDYVSCRCALCLSEVFMVLELRPEVMMLMSVEFREVFFYSDRRHFGGELPKSPRL